MMNELSEFFVRIIFDSDKSVVETLNEKIDSKHISYFQKDELFEVSILINQYEGMILSDQEENLIAVFNSVFKNIFDEFNITEFQLSIEVRSSALRPSISFGRNFISLLHEMGGDIDIDLL